MTFDPSKPASNESPDQFPSQCQANWSRLKTIITANHVFNDAVDASDGKHTLVAMPETSDGSEPTAASNEMVLYTKEGPTSQTELYLRREGTTGAFLVPTKDLPIFGVAAAGLFSGATPPVALGSRNVNMTATRDSLGVFTCTLTTALADANYFVVGSAQISGTTAADIVTWRINSKAAGSFQVVFSERTGGSNVKFDPTSWNMIVYGGL